LFVRVLLRNFLIFILIIGLLFFSAIAANQEEITLRFAVWETPFKISVYWWLLMAFGLGIFIGLLNTLFVNVRLRSENRRLYKQMESLFPKREERGEEH
tara:strand:- start:147 stop:443 length:297 start_codon:yes stop_codon:yes gene_type:complete